jgi:outer membrane protein assembly factor BamB
MAANSDLNNDGVIDLLDVIIFSDRHLGVDWQTVDWCEWILEDGRLQNKFDELVDFIRVYFECEQGPPPPNGEDPLEVVNENHYPTRLALGPDGRLFVSDAKSGSVFIYEVVVDSTGQTNLNLTGELKSVGKILGVVVDDAGLVYVGNSQLGRIDKYDLQGNLIGTFGQGTIRMPTDLTFDANGNLYVADSDSNVVWVYSPEGALLRAIRRGGLKMPMGVEIAYVDNGAGGQTGELYVADKTNYLVTVFDLQGNLLRSYGGFVEKEGWFNPTWIWEGKFVSLQCLAVDGNGKVHALDSYMNVVQVLEPGDGTFIVAYGETGTAPGQLILPLDLIISDSGVIFVANTDNQRVEVIQAVP